MKWKSSQNNFAGRFCIHRLHNIPNISTRTGPSTGPTASIGWNGALPQP
ncbi:hypothetical protein NG798_23180 [Ancylothrix sp. C2]|nr:hypothetical protein [Ancylothrix sp. D3o]MCT7952707.1 hypothetical protein [Ancylothrix sp. D3o]